MIHGPFLDPVPGTGTGKAEAPEDAAGRELARREDAARKFESLFLTALVKEMRQALPGEGLFGGGPGSAVYEGWFDQMMAEALAAGDGTGLRRSLLESWAAGDPVPDPGSPALQPALPPEASLPALFSEDRP